MSKTAFKKENGSIELIVAGLLAALLVVLALPLFLDPPADFKKKQVEQQENSKG